MVEAALIPNRIHKLPGLTTCVLQACKDEGSPPDANHEGEPAESCAPLLAEIERLEKELVAADAARDEVVYELEHQRVWFDATQQEAVNARQAESQAYKTLEADRREFEEVLIDCCN